MFCLSVVSVVIAPLSFLTLFTSSILLGEPGLRFVNFVYPFKESALDLIVFFFSIVFLSLYFISSLIFIILFLLLSFYFVCSSFSNSFKWQIRLFKIFLVTVRKACIAINFPKLSTKEWMLLNCGIGEDS